MKRQYQGAWERFVAVPLSEKLATANAPPAKSGPGSPPGPLFLVRRQVPSVELDRHDAEHFFPVRLVQQDLWQALTLRVRWSQSD